VKKTVATALGLGVLAFGAIVFGRQMLKPAAEKQERSRTVLTGLTEPRLRSCRVLEDSEIPEGLDKPRVGEDLDYLGVEIHYPGAARVPDHAGLFLGLVNGREGADLPPLHRETYEDEEGAYLYLVFRVEGTFEFGQIRRDDAVVLPRVAPE